MSAANRSRSKRQLDHLSLMRDLARRFKSLLVRLDGAELLADSIALDLARLEKYLETGALAQPNEDYLFAARRNKGQIRDRLRQLAEAGALSLEIKARSDGLSEVRIDEGKQFVLPPALADLLEIISLDSGWSDDELVGWKSLDDMAIFLSKKTGKRFTKHSVTQSIYRLRKELFNRGGANPFLVQTNKRRGVRFALRRKKVPVIESD